MAPFSGWRWPSSALGLLLSRWIADSRFGAQLVAVRENEDAARALACDVLAVKLKAITVSVADGGGGVLYLQYFLYLDATIAYGV